MDVVVFACVESDENTAVLFCGDIRIIFDEYLVTFAEDHGHGKFLLDLVITRVRITAIAGAVWSRTEVKSGAVLAFPARMIYEDAGGSRETLF